MAKKTIGVLEAIEVEPLRVGTMQVWLRGLTPLLCNCLNGRAKQELLFPKGRKSTGEKQQMLKHNPEREFRDSMHVRVGPGNTRVIFPAPAVKGAMMTAALETKGTNKTQIGRLVWVRGYSVDVFGIPLLDMRIVRMADQAKTPDVRTRAIMEQWCMPVAVQYVKPQMSERALMQLLSNGGIIVGVGDFRQEKGKGNFGQFEVVSEAECKDIIKSGGMKQQDEAIKAAECYDAASEQLLAWFRAEVKVRGKEEQLLVA